MPALNLAHPIPVPGCIVERRSDERRGEVKQARENAGRTELQVMWQNAANAAWVPIEELRSGFRLGSEVQDIPLARTRTSYGVGVIRESRTLGEREQHLVDYLEAGVRVWAPW